MILRKNNQLFALKRHILLPKIPHNVKNRVYLVLVVGVSHDLQMYDTRVLHKIF